MFYVILTIFGLYSATITGTKPIISQFANSQGASAFIIGVLVSCYSLFPMLLAVKIGKWLDHFGARRMITLGSCGVLFALMMPILYPKVVTLFFSQMIFGFSQLFILLSFQKTVGNWPGNRDKLVAAFSLTSSFGELAGPLITGFTYQHYGFRICLSVSVITVLLALFYGLMIKRGCWKSGASSLKDNNEVTESPWYMLKQKHLRNALIISGLVVYSKEMYVSFFPVYASDTGLSAVTIGVILSIMGGMSMAVRLCQFQLVQAFGRGMVLTATLIISGFSYILVTTSANVIFLSALTGLLGAGLGLGQPLSIVYAMNLTPPERHGEVLGIRLMFNRFSQFSAPFLLGGFGGIAGVVPVFWLAGGILLAGAYFTRMPAHELTESVDRS